MEAMVAEDLEESPVRIGLHRVAHGEPKCVREGESLGSGGLEGCEIVNVAGGAETLADGSGLGGGQKQAGHAVLAAGPPPRFTSRRRGYFGAPWSASRCRFAFRFSGSISSSFR